MDTEPTLKDRERRWKETEREYFVERGSKAWHDMWAWVGRHPLNEGVVNPTVAENHGETWQYMGTMKNSDGTYSHRFRHRFHPVREALGAEVRAYLRSANAPGPWDNQMHLFDPDRSDGACKQTCSSSTPECTCASRGR